jgi:hypothetical protein
MLHGQEKLFCQIFFQLDKPQKEKDCFANTAGAVSTTSTVVRVPNAHFVHQQRGNVENKFKKLKRKKVNVKIKYSLTNN